MSIRQKMLIWLLLIAVVVVFSNSFFLYKHWREVESAAIEDAESTARALALGLSFADEARGFSPMYKTPAKVQNYVEHIHSNLKEDIVMVDDQKKIVGDAVPEDVGKIFDHDKNNEVGQTIRDGITRTFIERSADFAAGFGRLLVIQVKSDEGEPVGALILEYTSYYDKYRAEIIYDLKTGLTISSIVLFMALVIGYFMSRNVTYPIARLKKASDEIAAGNFEVKVELKTRDEFGDLAAAFNTMVALRKAADEAVRESEARFRKLFENSNDAIFIHTMTGEILDANPQAENMMGYSVAVLKTMPVPALHPPEELETSKKAFEETISKGSARFESRFLNSGGALIDVEISARIVDREKGIIQGIARDITERKQAEETLRSAHEELLKKSGRLEMFQQVAVNREMRMVEMKDEVNGLLERLGEPRKYVEVDSIKKK